MGAIGRAEAGQDYVAILRHYYNDADIVALYPRPSPPTASATEHPPQP